MRDHPSPGARSRRTLLVLVLGAFSAWLVIQNSALLLAHPWDGAPVAVTVARALLEAAVWAGLQALPALALAAGALMWLTSRRAPAPGAHGIGEVRRG